MISGHFNHEKSHSFSLRAAFKLMYPNKIPIFPISKPTPIRVLDTTPMLFFDWIQSYWSLVSHRTCLCLPYFVYLTLEPTNRVFISDQKRSRGTMHSCNSRHSHFMPGVLRGRKFLMGILSVIYAWRAVLRRPPDVTIKPIHTYSTLSTHWCWWWSQQHCQTKAESLEAFEEKRWVEHW